MDFLTKQLNETKYYLNSRGDVYSKKDGTYRRLKNQTSNSGYHTISLYYDGARHTHGVHTLVWEVFKGTYDQSKYSINHIDGNKLNNHLYNLELTSYKENISHYLLTKKKIQPYYILVSKDGVETKLDRHIDFMNFFGDKHRGNVANAIKNGYYKNYTVEKINMEDYKKC